MNIPVGKQRLIARHLLTGIHSYRKIAEAVDVSPTTVRELAKRVHGKTLDWSALQGLNDDDFAQTVGTAPTVVGTRKPSPDLQHIRDELQRPDMTLHLLWQEFQEENPDCISYSHLVRKFGQRQKNQRLSMRQIHKAGEQIFVDFAGRTVPIVDQATGETHSAQIFVGVLGASQYIFAFAVASQQIHDWLKCHVEMFNHLGGVPQQVVPDNLKSAVIRNTKAGVVLSRAFAEQSEAYGFIVMPARPRKPRDKALAEVSVQIVQRGALARLRNRVFFSIEELNQALVEQLDRINSSTSKKLTKSRKQRFLEIDAPVLQPLPASPYVPAKWKYNVRVTSDYVVEFDGHAYSVPSNYRQQQVDLRITDGEIEVWYRRQRIARHDLSSKPGATIVEDHMPPNHRGWKQATPEGLVAWATSIGPNVVAFINLVLEARSDFANGLQTARTLRKWCSDEQMTERLDSICRYAVQIGAVTMDRIKSISRYRLDLTPQAAPTAATQAHPNLRGPGYYAAAGGSHD